MSLPKFTPLTKRIAAICGGIVVFILLIMAVLPYFFKDQINQSLKEIINKNIQGRVDYSDINLSFFRHFPSLTAAIEDVTVKGAAPFQDSTLIQAKEISVGVNLLSLLGSKVVLDKFLVSEGRIHVLVDSTGAANYNIYTATADDKESEEEGPSDSQMRFHLLQLKNMDLVYQDASIPMEIIAKNLNYEGRGNLTSAIFDLQTRAQIEAFTFTFDKEEYVSNKSIDARLVTQINTHDLSFVFEKNDIKINRLPVRFRGSFAFLNNGYHLDFKLKSQESTLVQLLSLLPQNYAQWLKDSKVKGTSEVFMNLEGDYIVEQNKMPNLSLGLIVNNGYLAYKNAKISLSDWNAKLRIDLPQLNPDSLHIDLKEFEFKVAEGFFKTTGQIRGMDPMAVQANIDSDMDLASLSDAVQWPDFTFGGKLNLDGTIDGTYATDTLIYGVRQHKKVYLSSIPTFSITNTLTDGYFKLAALPAPVDNIAYTLEAKGTDGQLKNAVISLTNLDIRALNNYIKGHAVIKDFNNFDVDANLKASIDLADIKQVYPIDSIELGGNISIDVVSKGRMDIEQKRVPATQAHIRMENGYFKSLAYPVPLEQIVVETIVSSPQGTLQDLHIQVLPVSFHLAGEPFLLEADLNNFNDIKYAVKSKGKLHLAPLYQLFATEGVKVDGYVETDFDLAGLQSDALKGNYNRLRNSGRLAIGNVQVETELLPKPILLKDGQFTFEREKLRFNQFVAQYGDNNITIRGFINNIVNYLLSDSEVIKGEFQLQSPSIRVDDFMVFAGEEESAANSTAGAGVVLLPENLDVQVRGTVDRVYYDQLQLNNFKGNLKLAAGKLEINDTGFELAGLKTNMNIKYRPLSTEKAAFDFAVKADSFDIQRAYKEIPMFQQMVTSAKNAAGVVSLDYQLGGLLDEQMSPIMPSLQGSGTLTLDQIKFYNFKLLNSISSATSKEGFLDSDVKQVAIRSSIKNNVMTIERTRMKMAGFRPRFEGQVTLDGTMNIGFRLGLPPFGVLGIPLRITGTSENYKIKLGKYREEDMDTDMDDEDKAAYEASLAPADSTTVQ